MAFRCLISDMMVNDETPYVVFRTFLGTLRLSELGVRLLPEAMRKDPFLEILACEWARFNASDFHKGYWILRHLADMQIEHGSSVIRCEGEKFKDYDKIVAWLGTTRSDGIYFLFKDGRLIGKKAMNTYQYLGNQVVIE